MSVRPHDFYGGSTELAISADQAIDRRAFFWVLTPSTTGFAAILPDARTIPGDPGRPVFAILNLGTDSLGIEDNLSNSTLATLAQDEIAFCFLRDKSDQDGTWSFRITTSGASPSAGPAEVMYLQGGNPTSTGNLEYDHQLDTWSTDTSSTNSHRQAAGFGLGTSTVVFGHNASPQDAVSQYTTAAGTWATLASFPKSIQDHHAESSGGKGYSLGSGFSTASNGKDTYESDASVSTWTAKTAKITASRLGSSSAVSGVLYVASGRDSTSSFVLDFEGYTISGDFWSSLVNAPSPAVERSTSFPIGAKVYKIAGNNGSDQDDVHEYSIGTGLWTTKGNLSLGNRQACGSASPEGIGLVAGGLAGATPQTGGVRYNPSLDSWTSITALPSATSVVENSSPLATSS